MTFDLTNPIFTNEEAAVAHLEAGRWPNGVVCPLCGVSEENTKLGGKTKSGLFQCNACLGKFSVRTGTVFERSHIPLHKWVLATYLMGASKKGISAHQLHRMLGITYKSAWFMAHRIREAMGPDAGPVVAPARSLRPTKPNSPLPARPRVPRVAVARTTSGSWRWWSVTAKSVLP